MNIEDIDIDKKELSVVCKLKAIFVHQEKLAKKYGPIELKSGLMQTTDMPVDLHSANGQARLKDFAWRVTEELTEATECLESTTMKAVVVNKYHFQEELIDALHFLVEMNILSGTYPILRKHPRYDSFNGLFEINPAPNFLAPFVLDHEPKQKYIKAAVYDVIESLGKAMNCLKNKPWKQSHIPTDIEKFNVYMRQAFHQFIGVLSASELDANSAFDLYIRKKEVNKFRQGSGY